MDGDPLTDHVDHNYNKCHRSCAVPLCFSSTEKTPEKLFVQVPSVTVTRDEWLRLAGCLGLPSSNNYFCEDHFDIQNDMVNYTEYKAMGHVQRVRLKVGCLPSKFECQQHLKELPLDDQKPDKMFKINVVQGRNIFSIETVSQEDTKKADDDISMMEKESEDMKNQKKISVKKPAVIKLKKCTKAPENPKRKTIVINPSLKQVKIIKRI